MRNPSIRISFVFLLAIMSITSFAQNWNFIKPDESYHFKHKGDTIPLNTILIDSAALVGSDSVFYLNRLFLPCDTCSTEGFYLDNQPSFLQRELVYSQVSSTVQLSNPEKYTLHLPDNNAKEWWFDTAQTQRATLASVDKEQVFGTNDSVATININGEPQIRIAKNIGLIKFFDYELSGLENAGLGVCLPGWKDFYNFKVGDVLQYEFSEEYGMASVSFGYYKQQVKSINTNNDTIKILWQIKRIEWWSNYSDTTIIRDLELTQIITKDDNSHAYPNQKKEISSGVFAIPIYTNNKASVQLNYNTSFEEAPYTGIISYEENIGFSNEIESIYVKNLKFIYQMGLGAIETIEDYGINGNHRQKMIGYIKNGDTTGIVYPDDYYLVPEAIDTTHIKSTKLLETLVSIYPNPSNGEITFNLGTEGEAKFEIYTLEGRLVEQFEIKNNQTQNLQHLNSAIYLISIQLKEGLQQLKWVKQ